LLLLPASAAWLRRARIKTRAQLDAAAGAILQADWLWPLPDEIVRECQRRPGRRWGGWDGGGRRPAPCEGRELKISVGEDKGEDNNSPGPFSALFPRAMGRAGEGPSFPRRPSDLREGFHDSRPAGTGLRSWPNATS